MPTTLAEVLDKTKNGKEILEVATQLGFQNVRLYHSFSENTLCLVVDFDIEKEKSYAVDRSASLLEFKIAKSFNCKVIVLQKDFMSSEDKTDVAKDSVLLPVTTVSQLIPIFGDPKQYQISTIEEDRRYKHDLNTFEAVHLQGTSKPNDGSKSNNSASSSAAAMTPLASLKPSASDASYRSAKSSASDQPSSVPKSGPAAK